MWITAHPSQGRELDSDPHEATVKKTSESFKGDQNAASAWETKNTATKPLQSQRRPRPCAKTTAVRVRRPQHPSTRGDLGKACGEARSRVGQPRGVHMCTPCQGELTAKAHAVIPGATPKATSRATCFLEAIFFQEATFFQKVTFVVPRSLLRTRTCRRLCPRARRQRATTHCES